MVTRKYLYVFSSLIFLLLLSNVNALNVISNVSISGLSGNNPLISCLRENDGKDYCYVLTGNSGVTPKISKFNSNGSLISYCLIANQSNILTQQGFVVINETHAKTAVSNRAHTWNLTNISLNTTCPLISYCNTGFGCCDGTCYGGYAQGSSYDSTNEEIYRGWYGITDYSGSLLSSPYWTVTGIYRTIRLINRTDNTTAYAYSLLPPTYVPSNITKYINAVYAYTLPNINDLYGIKRNYTSFDLIQQNASTTFGYIWEMISKTTANFYVVNFSSTFNQSTIVYDWVMGTVCDMTDSTHRAYYTNTTTEQLWDSCPSGTFCEQLTPQFNVSSGLVENYTSCQIRTTFGVVLNCINLCYNNIVVHSTCVEDGCKVCPDASGGFYYNSTYGYYTDTWYTNQSSVSVPYYTIACINTTDGNATLIIDEKGNSTNETELLTRAGNNITEGAPPVCTNTTTLCYDNGCNVISCGANSITSLGAWINTSLGTPYGSEVIAFITSMAFGIYIFMKVKSKNAETFIIPFLASLCGFCLPGVEFFPMWIWLLITIFTGVLIFWKAKS